MVINSDSPEWPYVQAAALLRARILAGEMGPRMPSHMDLADMLKVSPKTVQRALAILRDEGLIYSVSGRGTFVTEK